MEVWILVSSDTIVGIIGAVILTGAMIAVFYIEADRGDTEPGVDLGQGAQSFSFRYTESTTTDPDEEEGGPLSQGQSEDWPLPPLPYTFGVHVEVEWAGHELAAGPVMDAETVEFRVELIDGDTDVVLMGVDGDTSPGLRFEPNDNRSAPERMDLTVAADNLAEARGFVAQFMQEDDEVQQTARNWMVRVTLVNDGLILDDPLGTGDIQHEYSITVHVDHWHPEPRDA